MLQIIKDKSGMTLTELIVGLVLFAIITITASAILAPLLKVYTKANELAECNTLLDNVAAQIIKDLSNATVVIAGLDDDDDVLTDELPITIDTDDVTYTIEADTGILQKNGIPVLSKTYYKGKSVSFTCKLVAGDPGTAYTLTVIVLSDRDGEMICRDYDVKPLVLNQYEGSPTS